MRLCIDIGNSRIKWGWSEKPGALIDSASVRTVHEMFSAVARRAVPTRVLLADVRGGETRELLEEHIRKLRWPAPEGLISLERFEAMRNGYRNPESLGVDRFLALVATREIRPVVVVSAGTALTVDGMAADGSHTGGVIMPGLMAALNALGRAAPALAGKGDPWSAALNPWGRDTGTAVGSGILYAWVGGAERAITDIRERLGAECAVILTGGDGRLLKKCLKFEARYDELLVLRGMTYL
jgi:type III pantothenate kinase